MLEISGGLHVKYPQILQNLFQNLKLRLEPDRQGFLQFEKCPTYDLGASCVHGQTDVLLSIVFSVSRIHKTGILATSRVFFATSHFFLNLVTGFILFSLSGSGNEFFLPIIRRFFTQDYITFSILHI